MERVVAPIPRQTVNERFTAQIRWLVVLILCFVVLPSALLVSVGILVLVFGHQPHDIVFGVLILSLAATLIAGITATFLYVQRGTSLARLQTQFVQKVSHDLRTPLTSIRMFAETLQGGRLSDPVKINECIDVLVTETGRLTAMVERLLKWASMEAGKRIYHPVPASVRHVVERALGGLTPQRKLLELEGRLHLTAEYANSLPLIRVDLDAMSEAILNVLQNALRYTGMHKEIAIRCTLHERDVEIAISDNGPGIPKHEQRQIFEKFYRVVDPAKPNIEGSGLGLAIVRHIVRAHKGAISVDSDVGRGACFRIRLPSVEGRSG